MANSSSAASVLIVRATAATIRTVTKTMTMTMLPGNLTEKVDEKETGRLEARARQNVVLCILILLINSVLLLVIAMSHRLRRSAKYQLVCSLSVADMVLVGMTFLPLDTTAAQHAPRGLWPHDCRLLYVVYGLQEFVAPAITSLTLAALCLEYAATMCCATVTSTMKSRIVWCGVLTPWLFGMSALAYMFSEEIVTSSGSAGAACLLPERWELAVWVTLLGFFGFLPLLLLLCSLGLMLACRWHRPSTHTMAVRAIIARSDGVYVTHEMVDTFFACLISLALHSPIFVDLTLSLVCPEGPGACQARPNPLRRVFEVLRTAGSVVFPAVWILGMEFRRGLFTMCACCYKHCDLDLGPDRASYV